jgi:hypothetical protein
LAVAVSRDGHLVSDQYFCLLTVRREPWVGEDIDDPIRARLMIIAGLVMNRLADQVPHPVD